MKMATLGFAAGVVLATGALVSVGAGPSPVPTDGLQRTNTGEVASFVFQGHVLSTTVGAGGVLYCPSEADNPSFRDALSAELGGATVDYYDARAGTPTLDLLSGYDCVMTWVNFGYADPIGMGDVLADFVDTGGRVVLGQWCLPTAINWLQGRVMTAGYVPVTGQVWSAQTYNGDGVDCATDGVPGGLLASYVDNASLIAGNMSDGTYDNGFVFAAWRNDFRVWYAAGNTGGFYTPMDVDVVWAARMCRCPDGPVQPCPEDIDGNGAVDIGDLLAVLAAWGPCDGGSGSECDTPWVCGQELEYCDPATNCICFTAPDGSGVCGASAICSDLVFCFGGQGDCPEGTNCTVDTCCVDPVCSPVCGAGSSLPADIKPGELLNTGVYNPEA